MQSKIQNPKSKIQNPPFEVLVIGGGLIGSAALRHLSEAGVRAGLMGPGEPEDWARHDGVFASHYDEGRITRSLDKDAVWGRLAQRSIARYRSIEAASGIRFYEPRGFLHLGPSPPSPAVRLARAEVVGKQLGVRFERLDDAVLRRRFPYLHIPPGTAGLYQPDDAGCINPRALAQAQQAAARALGAVVIHDTALSTHRAGDLIEVRTRSGDAYRCRKLLVATGAFTNHFDLLDRPVALDVKAETVWLGRVSPAEAQRLRGMPSIWYDFEDHPVFPYAYILPPIRYPDGHTYLKIGVDRDPDAEKTSLAEIIAFFQSGGHVGRGEELRALLQSIFPTLLLDQGLTKPCILSYTPQNYPMVDAVGASGVFVAVGGCGGSAKSSDEIGRMAALLAQHGTWTHDLDAALFRVE